MKEEKRIQKRFVVAREYVDEFPLVRIQTVAPNIYAAQRNVGDSMCM